AAMQRHVGYRGIAESGAASARQLYEFTDWMHRPPPAPRLLDGPRPQVPAKLWRREVAEHDNVYDFTGAGGPCGSAAAASTSRSPASTRCTLTKNTGTINSAKITTAIMPPMTLVPSACWLAPPAPLAITIGSTPQTKARPVIRIGRKRNEHASIVASTSGLPCARRSLANSMMRMASFAARPMIVIRPTVK